MQSLTQVVSDQLFGKYWSAFTPQLAFSPKAPLPAAAGGVCHLLVLYGTADTAVSSAPCRYQETSLNFSFWKRLLQKEAGPAFSKLAAKQSIALCWWQRCSQDVCVQESFQNAPGLWQWGNSGVPGGTQFQSSTMDSISNYPTSVCD